MYRRLLPWIKRLETEAAHPPQTLPALKMCGVTPSLPLHKVTTPEEKTLPFCVAVCRSLFYKKKIAWVECVRNLMAHGDACEGKWRGNWRMGSQYSHTTSERGVSSNTTADAHTSAASSRPNWRPAALHGLVRFGERRNLVSARVPSRFKRSILKHSSTSTGQIWQQTPCEETKRKTGNK
jgi:hypothetical protein